MTRTEMPGEDSAGSRQRPLMPAWFLTSTAPSGSHESLISRCSVSASTRFTSVLIIDSAHLLPAFFSISRHQTDDGLDHGVFRPNVRESTLLR